jgi:hypothetical protein
MKPIEARSQVRLGPGRCFRLALTGMSYRMFRSMITVAILSLAVAFLVHMVSYGLMTHETERSAYRELARERELGQVITRLTTEDLAAQILTSLGRADADRIPEYRQWSKAESGRFDRALETARALREAAFYLSDLPVAAHAVLLGDRTPEQLFDELARPERFERFAGQLRSVGVKPPLGDLERFRRSVTEERAELLRVVGEIARGQREAIEQIHDAYPERTPNDLAAHPPSDFPQRLASAGYSFPRARIADLAEFGQRAEELRTINRLLLTSDVRAAVARETKLAIADVSFEALLEYVDDDSRAAWFSGVATKVEPKAGLSPARVQAVFEHKRHEQRLAAAAGDEPPSEVSGLLGMPTRTRWLIALSFLVCVVGVANAMLMSVTERFTEIATMKCLGALDRFVMLMFVFEATIQGLIGGAIGVLLGLLLALLRGVFEFGGLLRGAVGAGPDIGLGVLASLAVGVLLAALAAVGPSWLAARLAPMEAMRVD